MRKKPVDAASTRLALATFREKVLQLQNDLAAAKIHIELHRKGELRLADQINTLRNEVRLSDEVIKRVTGECQDWRDAFKLIMRLVK